MPASAADTVRLAAEELAILGGAIAEAAPQPPVQMLALQSGPDADGLALAPSVGLRQSNMAVGRPVTPMLPVLPDRPRSADRTRPRFAALEGTPGGSARRSRTGAPPGCAYTTTKATMARRACTQGTPQSLLVRGTGSGGYPRQPIQAPPIDRPIDPFTGKWLRKDVHARTYHRTRGPATMRITECRTDNPGNKTYTMWMCPRGGEPGAAWRDYGRKPYQSLRVVSTGDQGLGNGLPRPSTAP